VITLAYLTTITTEGFNMERSADWLNRSSSSVKVFYPKFDTRQVIALVKKGIEPLSTLLPLKLVALFGSYARGNYTVASDVDLLVIYGGKSRPNAYNIVKKALQIPRLEPHVYSESEYNGNKEVIDRMLRDSNVLFRS
jgi:predicted nucleotidyltransferase